MEIVSAGRFQSVQNLIGIAAIDAAWIGDVKMFAGDREISLVRPQSRRDEMFIGPGAQYVRKLRRSVMLLFLGERYWKDFAPTELITYLCFGNYKHLAATRPGSRRIATRDSGPSFQRWDHVSAPLISSPQQ